jgi:hypothetical protein
LRVGGAGDLVHRGAGTKDQPHNNLLLPICHAMGLADLKSFGIPKLCTGPLANLAV